MNYRSKMKIVEHIAEIVFVDQKAKKLEIISTIWSWPAHITGPSKAKKFFPCFISNLVKQSSQVLAKTQALRWRPA